MNELPDNEIGQVLAGAVPPLREPADRLDEVRTRVRRSRLRARGAVFGAVAAVAALAIAVPQLVIGASGTAPPAAQATVLGPDDCPGVADAGPRLTESEADRPGPMVPDGAVEVMSCERGIDESTGLRTDELLDQRVLTTGVDQLVAALNELPTGEEYLAALGPEYQEAWADGNIPCKATVPSTWRYLVLLYPGGDTVTVHMNEECGTTTAADGPVRYGSVLAEFERLYEAQLTPEAPDTSAELAECPATWQEPTMQDAPGQLVRPGAVDVTLCPIDEQGGEPRLLTTGVDQLVDALNDLEPIDLDNLFCVSIAGDLPGPSLVLRYPDGGTTVVYTDWRCKVSMVDGTTRLGDGVQTFRRLHREQLAATIDPGSISTPSCPEVLEVDGLNPAPVDVWPANDIDRYGVRYTETTPLPSPLVAAATCRYTASEGGARLVDSHEQRSDLAGLRDAINETFGWTDDGPYGHPECASSVDSMGASVPDLILVADATGDTAEYWVYLAERGAPCLAAFDGPAAWLPTGELVAYLRSALGP